MKHAVLVTGGRNYTHPERVDAYVAELPPGTLVIHGGARGVDSFAGEAADRHGRPQARVPYFSWLGRAGGHVRNGLMVELAAALQAAGWLVKVAAFPGGDGTENCVTQARAAGLPVQHVG